MGTITAVFHRRSGRQVTESEVTSMLAVSQVRARDGEDIWCDGEVALGRQHFWATPEEVGQKQPILGAGHHHSLVCSARIDNRRELGKKLGLGDEWAAAISDAEYFSLAYTCWGESCFEHVEGDFAVIIWDMARQQLVIARDRLGAKGVYYHITPDCAMVATEIQQLVAHPAIPKHLNESKVAAYMGELWEDSSETFYEQIFQCRPAEVVVVAAGSVRRFNFWEPSQRPVRYKREDEYVSHFRELVTTAVAHRLRAVGCVGISMSGGLDSTMIAALAATDTAIRPSLKTFSYVFDQLTSCDEREYSQLVVDQYGLDMSWLPGDDLWPLRGYPDHWPGHPDYIMADAYCLLPAAIYGAASNAGCRVVLNGQFGDVLYSGARYWGASVIRHLKLQHLMREAKSASDYLNWGKQYLWQAGLLANLPYVTLLAARKFKTSRMTWSAEFGLDPAFLQRTGLEEKYRAQRHEPAQGSIESVARRRALLHPSWAEGNPVSQAICQSQGVTVWMPLHDRQLLEFTLNVPAHLLGVPSYSRRIARESMRDILPERVRQRQTKTDFEALNVRGTVEQERTTIAALLREPRIVTRGYIDQKWLHGQSLDHHLANDETRYRLWQWLSLELWLRRFWDS